jgi:hypothetical protein
MTSVTFCTPSRTHSVSLEYLQAHTETIFACLQAGIRINWLPIGGDQFVAKARCRLVEEFLEGEAENLFFLDDDIGWPAEKVVEFLSRPEPIIAGIYPKKQDTEDWPVALYSNEGQLERRDGMVRATMIPTGFTKIHRSVLEALAKQLDKAPEEAPTWFMEMGSDGVNRRYRGFFNAGIGPDHQWWGEDHAFGQNAMALGYELWVDPNIEFSHRGQKRWRGNLYGSLGTFSARAQEAFYMKQKAELAEAEPMNMEPA